jgi:uncharacterized membrane protein YkgB
MKKIIYYSARVLSILIFVFFSLFILEAFDPAFGIYAGMTHLLMALAVLLVLVVAWKWPRVGGWFFAASGVYGLFFLRPAPSSFIIEGIFFLTGLLFLIEGFLPDKKAR